MNLTFAEQVKIILSRKGMTIKELAARIEEQTGMKMSRQNLTQRLGRDNFQEKDMRMIASILECPFYLNILDNVEVIEHDVQPTKKSVVKAVEKALASDEAQGMFVEEVSEAVEKSLEEAVEEAVTEVIAEELAEEVEEPEQAEPAYEEPVYEEPVYEEPAYDDSITLEEVLEADPPVEELLEEMEAIEREQAVQEQIKETKEEQKESGARGWRAYLQRRKKKDEAPAVEKIVPEMQVEEEPVEEPVYEELSQQDEVPEEPVYAEPVYEEVYEEDTEDLTIGEMNPYTNREYETNTVRMHPKRIGYVQVYDRGEHKWNEMTEWAFLGYQERKKVLLGDDYEPPIYLD